MILNKKRALVLGATGGVGSAISKELAQHVEHIILQGRDVKLLDKVEKEIRHDGLTVLKYSCDLSDLKDVEKFIARLRLDSAVDIIINCAGVFNVVSYLEEKQLDIVDCVNVNLISPMLVIKEIAKGMVKNKWGRIVNITSSSAYIGFPNTVSYCATKHGLLGFSRALHSELRSHGVRVYSIAPGSIQTKMGKKVKNQDYQTFIEPKDLSKLIADIIAYDGNMVADEIRVGRMDYQ